MQIIRLPQPDVAPLALGFSPDGRRLAAWDDCGAGRGAAVRVGRGRVARGRVQPDGLRCAAAGVGVVVVWDVDA